MTPFDYAGSPDPVRPDLAEAHRRAWRHVAGAGTWLTGAERVAVAGETRRARTCTLCAERRAALSPRSVPGAHEPAGPLPAPLVDAIHRVTTDAARFDEPAWRSLVDGGVAPEVWVEALGVATLVISVDAFHCALGLPEEPLPEPAPGEPSRLRPDDVVLGEAFVPMQSGRAAARLVGLPAGPAPFVLRALSLVPAEVEAWTALSGAQYLGTAEMRRFRKLRALDRSQMELVAGRVSALNECFY